MELGVLSSVSSFSFDFDSCASISIWMVSPGGNTRLERTVLEPITQLNASILCYLIAAIAHSFNYEAPIDAQILISVCTVLWAWPRGDFRYNLSHVLEAGAISCVRLVPL